MRNFFWILLLISSISSHLKAQVDTTIYPVAIEMPRFYYAGCEAADTTNAAIAKCAEQAMLALIYGNLEYPLQARLDNIEGTVVASFVVEPDSSISNISLLRDIGGGCGASVVNLLSAFNPSNIKWIPGKNDGKMVRTRMNIPIKFALKEAPPYILIGQDTVYTRLDTPLAFKPAEGLTTFVEQNLTYPTSAEDSCKVGYMDVQLLVRADGIVQSLNVVDYFNLGLDYQFEIINLTGKMLDKWEVATYQNRKVPTSVELRLPFLPEAVGCKANIDRYNKANAIANEGINLIEDEKVEEGIAKLSEALEITPENADYRSLRAEYYVELGNFEEACQELLQLKATLGKTAFDSMLPIICQKAGEK